jgi:hypothetical protein
MKEEEIKLDESTIGGGRTLEASRNRRIIYNVECTMYNEGNKLLETICEKKNLPKANSNNHCKLYILNCTLKKQSAITLIALIITIIVMLILARSNNKPGNKWRVI